MSRLTRTSLMLAFFIATDKILGVIRQVIIARSFGLSSELDVFNVANNLPDLLFALISGGAMAVVFIPVLSEVLAQKGRPPFWELFSKIANLAFLVTLGLAIIITIFADPLVRWSLGIAPGFAPDQQALVAQLMRLNLIATMIFSISGLIMAGLQANQHFLLPALAPVLYNLGQIFGALILAPTQPYVILGITLPAFGLGVYGLVYGVMIGASLHLAIQIPGLIMYHFRWLPALDLSNSLVRRVIRLFGPRLLMVFIIQLTFIVRDNLASRLQAGSVTALTYGWMIMQVPETLIGTAIGIALLPTLSELASKQDWEGLRDTIERAVQVLLAITLPISIILIVGLRPFLAAVFRFDAQGTDLLLWVTRGYLLGLTGQCLLEVANRSFYAQQNVRIPLIGSFLNLGIYIILGVLLFRPIGATGISVTDSIAFTTQAVMVLIMLNRKLPLKFSFNKSGLHGAVAAVAGGGVSVIIFILLNDKIPDLLIGTACMFLGGLAALPFIRRELRILLRL
jgi:putative peptidoglycan lipid II flippase